jgi:hypothetical protein
MLNYIAGRISDIHGSLEVASPAATTTTCISIGALITTSSSETIHVTTVVTARATLPTQHIDVLQYQPFALTKLLQRLEPRNNEGQLIQPLAWKVIYRVSTEKTPLYGIIPTLFSSHLLAPNLIHNH